MADLSKTRQGRSSPQFLHNNLAHDRTTAPALDVAVGTSVSLAYASPMSRRALAIETSGRIGSVALIDENGAIEEREFPHGLQHAAGLIPLIDQLCSQR